MNPFLLPIAAYQGKQTMKNMAQLPEASGPRTGSSGVVPGVDPDRFPIQVLVVGESTAASCGADTHANGFAGNFARVAAGQTGRPAEWTVVAKNGASLRRVRHRLIPEIAKVNLQADLCVLLIGVNDVLARVDPEVWRLDLIAVLDQLRPYARHVVMAGVPPFAQFPSLPKTLGKYLGEKAWEIDWRAKEIIDKRADATWISSAAMGMATPEFFATDGFHPSALGYQRWTQCLGDHIEWPPRH